jgi:hypothetical protein
MGRSRSFGDKFLTKFMRRINGDKDVVEGRLDLIADLTTIDKGGESRRRRVTYEGQRTTPLRPDQVNVLL